MPFGVADFEQASPASGSFSEDDFVDLPQAKPPGVLSQLGQSLLPGNILNNLVAPAAVGAYNAIGQGFINAPASLYKHIMGQPTEERILGVPGVHSTLPFKPVQQGVPITDIRIPDADVNPISAAVQTMVNGATTPENLMLGVASGGEGILAKAGRGLFLPPLAEGVVQGAKTAFDSSLSPNERIQGLVEGGAAGLMTHGVAHSLGPKFTAADFASKQEVKESQPGSIGYGLKQAVAKNQESGMVNLGKISEGGLPEGVKKVQDIEKENRGDFALTGTRFLLDPKESGFSNSEKPIDAQHVWNRLANKLKAVAPDELAYYESQGLDKEIVGKGKVSPQEVAITLAARGPRIETKILKSGADNNDPIAQGYATLRHEFYDNLPNDAQAEMDRVVSGAVDVEDWIAKHGSPDRDGYIDEAFGDAAKNYADFAYKMEDRPEAGVEGQKFDPDVYRRVAPKDKDQTVVMVRVPYRPIDKGTAQQTGATEMLGKPLHEGGHFGPEDRNLIGWTRGQWETTPEGKRIFHVIEQQDDLIIKHSDGTYEVSVQGSSKKRHATWAAADKELGELWPITKQRQRLAMKATVEHVKKEGGDGVALSDGPTAMMTEGQDLNAHPQIESKEFGFDGEGQHKAENAAKELAKAKGVEPVQDIHGNWSVSWKIGEPVITQEPGMRLNYDRILPKILEELTGKKGEKVDFGEHQMAMEVRAPSTGRVMRLDQAGPGSEAFKQPRENLIFKNPDGTPKTSATALHYPLDKVPSQAASLFEKDKPTSRETKLYGGIPFLDPDFYKGIGDKVQQAVDLASTKTVPATMRAHAETGNALVRYAISRSGVDKQNLVDSLMKRGLAKDAATKVKAIGGKGVEPITFTIKGRKPRTLLVRSDIAPEVTQAIQGHGKLVKGIIGHLFDLNTKLQTQLGVDFVWHTGNMLAAVNGATRAKLGANVDLLGSRELNTVYRVGKNLVRDIMNDPTLKREIAQYTKIGAGRGELVRPGLFGGEAWSAKWLKAIDQAGRVTLNQMYDELATSKLVKNTEHGRREFVNQMGQYNSALMSRAQQLLRDSGISPFVVAGRTFNKLAIQRLLASPGVEAANKIAWTKMRVYNLVGMTTALLVTPAIVNMYKVGTPFGRKGVPVGAIDTGKDGPDGEPIYIDVAQMYLARRGARITGLDATVKGITKVDSTKNILGSAARDVIKGVAHPYAGPAVKSGFEFASSVKETPKRIGEHAITLAMNINPTVGAAFRGAEAVASSDKKDLAKGAAKELGKTFGGAFGLKMGPKPSFEDRRNALSQQQYGSDFSKLSMYHMLKVQEKMDQTKEARTDKQKEEASIYQAHSMFDRIKEIKAGLSADSRDFVDHFKLQIPNIETSIRKNNTTISLDKDQADKLVSVTTKFYEEGIQRLANRAGFTNANVKSKEYQFEANMHNAKNKARHELKLPLLER